MFVKVRVKSGANGWLGRLQMGGQVRAITQVSGGSGEVAPANGEFS